MKTAPHGKISRRYMVSSLVLGQAMRAQSSNTGRTLPAEVWTGLKPETRTLLTAAVSAQNFRGRLASATVERALQVERRPIEDFMLSLLPLAQAGARPPLSRFFVGAVARGASGSLYLGANIEVPGHGLGLSVHGEQAATANAYMHDESGITHIAVTGTPCGHCRQFLNEISLDGGMWILVRGQRPKKLSDLLPMAFGPRDLGQKQGALPPRENKLALEAGGDALAAAALAAARKSYSPYTNSPAGVAFHTSDRRTYSGSYIENAAFNPSLPPAQTALAALFAAGGAAEQIQRVVLVEAGGAGISQESGVRATLSSLAPGARIEVLKAKRA